MSKNVTASTAAALAREAHIRHLQGVIRERDARIAELSVRVVAEVEQARAAGFAEGIEAAATALKARDPNDCGCAACSVAAIRALQPAAKDQEGGDANG